MSITSKLKFVSLWCLMVFLYFAYKFILVSWRFTFTIILSLFIILVWFVTKKKYMKVRNISLQIFIFYFLYFCLYKFVFGLWMKLTCNKKKVHEVNKYIILKSLFFHFLYFVYIFIFIFMKIHIQSHSQVFLFIFMYLDMLS